MSKHPGTFSARMRSRIRPQAGFTLVDTAIVLILVGLLLGGALKAREMVTQARIKNIIDDFSGVTAALYAYQDRYRALPGDEKNSITTARWGATGRGGDGNGVLCTNDCPTPLLAAQKYNATAVPAAAAAETGLFWLHLRLAGFVGGSTEGIAATQQPNNAAGGIMGVQTTGMGFGGNIICSSNLPDSIAVGVDAQMDEGTPEKGRVRGQLQTASNPDTASSAVTYQENGTNRYLLCLCL